ncbi:hypothetical protein [Kitasatospora sp. NPDC058478]|uniref:hypothetical protein n=1 Tax=unclassified Kitasatospora TaxID=2633591 RepID=UPI0036482914
MTTHTQPTDPREHFAIRDGARYLYHLPSVVFWDQRNGGRASATDALHGDGHPLTPLPGRRGWWAADREITTVTATWTPRSEITGYTLTDPGYESAKYKSTLTPAEYRALRDEDGDHPYRIYDPVTQDQDPVTEEVACGPWLVLGSGEQPPATNDPRWVADLPRALTSHPEFRWWLPGKLTGLRAAVEAHAKKRTPGLFGVSTSKAKYDGVDGQLCVEVDVPFERPVTRQEDTDWMTGKKLRRPKTVRVTVKRKLVLPVPPSVHADNYAAALADWDTQYAYWTGLIDSEIGVRACNHCGGHGYIPDGAEEYTPAPASRKDAQ